MILINGIVFIFCSFVFGKVKIINMGIFIFLIINLILTFTNQMGLFDYFILALNIITIFALLFYAYFEKLKQ